MGRKISKAFLSPLALSGALFLISLSVFADSITRYSNKITTEKKSVYVNGVLQSSTINTQVENEAPTRIEVPSLVIHSEEWIRIEQKIISNSPLLKMIPSTPLGTSPVPSRATALDLSASDGLIYSGPLYEGDFTAPYWNGNEQDYIDHRGVPIETARREEIIRRERFGMVGIDVVAGDLVAYGAGTFVSSDGLLITNYHVLKHAVQGRGSAKFTFPSGEVLDKFQKIQCDGLDSYDLCLVKLDVQPKYWFPIKATVPLGDKLFMLGLWRKKLDLRSGYDRGLTLLGKKPRREVTAPVRPGFSGGPIFDSEGKLVCIASDNSDMVTRNERPIRSSVRHFCVDGAAIRSYLGQ